MQLTESIEKVLTGKLNTTNSVGIGVPLASVSGMIVQEYVRQLGKRICMDVSEVKYDSTTGTLYGGIYQYVKFYGSSSGSNALGQIVFWQTPGSYVVTPDAAATNLGNWAGITLNAVTKGYYGWIQVGGRATVKFSASITKATPAAGDLCYVDQSAANTANIPEDATAQTAKMCKSHLGVVETAAVGGATAVVQLWTRFWNCG